MTGWDGVDMSGSLTLTFAAPYRPLSINDYTRMHWAPRRRILDAYRDAAETHARIAKRRGYYAPDPAYVLVTLPFARAGRRDPHNYTSTVVKAIVDGLVRAGLWDDDTPEHVRVADPRLAVGISGRDPYGLVRVTLDTKYPTR